MSALGAATPADYDSYNSTEHYLGQAMLDMLENGADMEAPLAQPQDAFEAGP